MRDLCRVDVVGGLDPGNPSNAMVGPKYIVRLFSSLIGLVAFVHQKTLCRKLEKVLLA